MIPLFDSFPFKIIGILKRKVSGDPREGRPISVNPTSLLEKNS